MTTNKTKNTKNETTTGTVWVLRVTGGGVLGVFTDPNHPQIKVEEWNAGMGGYAGVWLEEVQINKGTTNPTEYYERFGHKNVNCDGSTWAGRVMQDQRKRQEERWY